MRRFLGLLVVALAGLGLISAECPGGFVACPNQTPETCVDVAKFCDGVLDCEGGEDENNDVCEVAQICGESKVQPNNTLETPAQRIIGGTPSVPGSWPWMFHMQRISSRGPRCGGSLISRNWIMTAGHCVSSTVHTSHQFVGGVLNRGADEPNRYEARLTRCFSHPSYTGNVLRGHDLALCRLEEPVPFETNDFIHPVCLPTKDFRLEKDQILVMTGWGRTEGTGNALLLNQVNVPFVPMDICNDRDHLNGQVQANPETQLCLGFEAGRKGQCSGDSGSGVVREDDRGRWTAYGAVSWSAKPRGCASPMRPGVQARVSSMLDFVFDTIINN